MANDFGPHFSINLDLVFLSTCVGLGRQQYFVSCVFCVLRKRECVCVMCVFEVNEVLLYEKRTHVKVCVCVVCCGSVRVSACVCRTPMVFVSSLKPMKFYCMRREHVIYINI